MTIADVLCATQIVLGLLVYVVWLKVQNAPTKKKSKPVFNDWLHNCIEHAREVGDIVREKDSAEHKSRS